MCHSMTRKVLWLDNFCRRGITDGLFGQGGIEKGLIITVRYWRLKFSDSEVLEIGITRKQTVSI